LNILALPYPSESRLREVLSDRIDDDLESARDYNARIAQFMLDATRAFDSNGVSIIASHLYVNGGLECESERQIQVGGAYAVDAKSFPTAASYVALGHLHRPQEHRGANDLPVRYSGSILQYSFSEEQQQKSVTIVDVDEKCARYREVPLNAGRTLYRWHDLRGLDELEGKLVGADATGWYSINVELDEPIDPEYVSNLRAHHPGIVNCITRYRLDANGNGDAQRLSELSLEEQFRRFVEHRFNEPVSDDVMKLFLEMTMQRE
jgi:exonuclease SbcD